MKKFDRSLISQISRRGFMQGSAAAMGITLVGAGRGWAAEEKRINIYNWDTYMGDTTLGTFNARTGIQVQYDLFADNEELYAKLKEGNPGYDLIFPSDYMIEIMITTGTIVPLDHSKIPNLANIHPNFRNQAYDPNMKHSAPYMWGTMGFGYRKSKFDKAPDSWGVVLDPKQASKYAGKIAMLGDQRATIGAALKYLGYSLNTIDPGQIAEARDLLIVAKNNFKTFAADNGQDLLLSGEVDVTMEWNGDILQVMEEDDDISYIVPKEGSIVWSDSMCIPKDAPHPDNAHAFINHVLDAKVNADLANSIHYATANAAAKPMLLQEDLDNPAVYPPDSIVATCEAIIDVGNSTRLYDEAWTAVQAA